MEQSAQEWFTSYCREECGVERKPGWKLRNLLSAYLLKTTGTKRKFTRKQSTTIVEFAQQNGITALPAYLAEHYPLAKGRRTEEVLNFIDPDTARVQNRYVHNRVIGHFLDKSFYRTPEWRRARYAVLLASDGRCQACGRSAEDGVILHIDHIQPKSLFPELALDPENLQVLCADCNLGKSNGDWTRWKRRTA